MKLKIVEKEKASGGVLRALSSLAAPSQTEEVKQKESRMRT